MKNEHLIEEKEYKIKIDEQDYLLKISQDDYEENPREWDNLCNMFCWNCHGYKLGDELEHETMFDFFVDTIQEFAPKNKQKRLLGLAEEKQNLPTIIDELKKYGVFINLLGIYDHSGISLFLTDDVDFADKWDTGLCGVMMITKEMIEKETVYKENWEVTAERMIEGELKTYNYYLEGNVWGYNLYKINYCKTCGHEELEDDDSCCGFYGDTFENCGILDYLPKDILKTIEEQD